MSDLSSDQVLVQSTWTIAAGFGVPSQSAKSSKKFFNNRKQVSYEKDQSLKRDLDYGSNGKQ